METRLGETTSADSGAGLLRALGHNDPSAWERLFRIYAPLILRRARLAGLDERGQEDVARDVLLRVSQGVRGFERQAGPFRKWLGAITDGRLGGGVAVAPSEDDERQERRLLVEGLLAELPGVCLLPAASVAAFRLHYLEGMSVQALCAAGHCTGPAASASRAAAPPRQA